MDDLYKMYEKYNIPIYVSFHYDWWKDKNLERFGFLTENQKRDINVDPFISILFAPLDI